MTKNKASRALRLRGARSRQIHEKARLSVLTLAGSRIPKAWWSRPQGRWAGLTDGKSLAII